jgi:hypothetical protein
MGHDPAIYPADIESAVEASVGLGCAATAAAVVIRREHACTMLPQATASKRKLTSRSPQTRAVGYDRY